MYFGAEYFLTFSSDSCHSALFMQNMNHLIAKLTFSKWEPNKETFFESKNYKGERNLETL